MLVCFAGTLNSPEILCLAAELVMMLGTAQEITKLPFLIKSLTWRDKPTRPTVKTTSGFKLIAFKESNAGALETIPDPTH